MTPEQAKQRIAQLSKELQEHNYRYYVMAEPSVDDYTFDRLLEELQGLEKEYPQFRDPNSPTAKVGGAVNKQFRTVKHKYPMLSLGNTYSEEELDEFDARIRKSIGDDFEYVCELKFDGLAIGITYRDGKLVQAVTRGDGVQGDDVTDNVRTIKAIPHQLHGDYPPEFENTRGDFYAPQSI